MAFRSLASGRVVTRRSIPKRPAAREAAVPRYAASANARPTWAPPAPPECVGDVVDVGRVVRVRRPRDARQDVAPGVGREVVLHAVDAFVAVEAAVVTPAPYARLDRLRVDARDRRVAAAARSRHPTRGEGDERAGDPDDQPVSSIDDVGYRPAPIVIVGDVPREGGAVERAPLTAVVDAVEDRADDQVEGVLPTAAGDEPGDDVGEYLDGVVGDARVV